MEAAAFPSAFRETKAQALKPGQALGRDFDESKSDWRAAVGGSSETLEIHNNGPAVITVPGGAVGSG